MMEVCRNPDLLQPEKVKTPIQAHSGTEDSFKGFADPPTVKAWWVTPFIPHGVSSRLASCATYACAHAFQVAFCKCRTFSASTDPLCLHRRMLANSQGWKSLSSLARNSFFPCFQIVKLLSRTGCVTGWRGFLVAPEFFEYEGEGHAFMNGSEGIKKMMDKAGLPTDMKQESQDKAWERVFAFFNKTLA